MRANTIVNNCIFDIIKDNKFNKIFVYGSENLELEKFIYKSTSSSIIGGDVDFCNVMFGKYFSTDKNLKLNKEIYGDLGLNINSTLSDIEKLSLAIIYKTYKPKENNEHNKRIFNNIIKNIDNLNNEIKNQINCISLELSGFEECKIEEFIQNITNNDLLIIDNTNYNFINNKLLKLLYNSNFRFAIISRKDIIDLHNNQILKSQSLNIYSNINLKANLLTVKTNKPMQQKMFDIIEDEAIENIEIKQLSLPQFNALRQKYLSKQLHYFGTPKISFGLFTNNKLFGAFGLTNDYRNKPPKEIETPSIYLLSDFVVNSNVKKLSKLILYCVLSKEVKLLAERLLNKEVKTIYTNVFTKNMSSVKYRDLFSLLGRKQFQNGSYNLTYFSQMGKWNLKEGLKLWIQKL